MKPKRKDLKTLITSLILAICVSSIALAGTFVSFNGQFTIEYPEGWNQVDYKTSDVLLSQVDPTLNYEAAFTSSDSGMPFDDAYFILVADTVGQLTQRQIDSITTDIVKAHDNKSSRVDSDNFITSIELDKVQILDDGQAVAILADITTEAENPLKNLFVMRFYEKGIVKFYFFGPGDDFETNLKTYYDIFMSFSTDNIEDALKSEPVKIADIKEDKSESPGFKSLGATGGFIAILIVILIAVRRKKRQGKK